MLLNSYTKTCDFFSSIYTIKVEQHHIDFLDRQTWCKSRFHADSLIFEYDILYNKLGTEAVHKGHDVIFGDMLTDFKEIFSKWHNINTDENYKWLKKCVIEEHVTHYAPYQVINRDRNKDRRENRIYQVEDILHIEVFEFEEARSYIKRASKSIRDNCAYYIIPQKKLKKVKKNVYNASEV